MSLSLVKLLYKGVECLGALLRLFHLLYIIMIYIFLFLHLKFNNINKARYKDG